MSQLIRLRNIKRALALEPPDLAKGKIFHISGRVQNWRGYKEKNFIDLADGSTREHLQVVIKRELLDKPRLGSYLTLRGRLVPSRGQQQTVEFQADDIESAGDCDPETYPLATSGELPSNHYRRWLHLRPRVANFASLLRVKSELEFALHMIMKQMDFIRVHTPTLSSNDSEASSDLFTVQRTKLKSSDTRPAGRGSREGEEKEAETEAEEEEMEMEMEESKGAPESSATSNPANKRPSRWSEDENNQETTVQGSQRSVSDGYFKRDVYLVTSAQLHLETLAASLSRVYTIGNAFRAENSQTRRHLCEFLMFEAEEANVTQLAPLMDRVETIVKFLAQFLANVSDHRRDFTSLVEANAHAKVLDRLCSSQFIRMHYEEALETLRNKTDYSGSTHYGCDIGRVMELKLLEHCDNVPIFITNYPKKLKPFYMKQTESEDQVECFDLIAPLGGEICGGSLREHNLERLTSNLGATEGFQWYLDLRRFGTFPHGGFGIGLDRLAQSLLGYKNIRDTVAFPRWPGQCPM